MRTSTRERMERVESMRAAPIRADSAMPWEVEHRMGVRMTSARQVPSRMDTDMDTPMETDLSIWRGSIWAAAEGPVTRTGVEAMASHGILRQASRRSAARRAEMRSG